MNAPRSGCPIKLTLEALGDRWGLIVTRDLMFGNRRRFRELLSQSEASPSFGAVRVWYPRVRRLRAPAPMR